NLYHRSIRVKDLDSIWETGKESIPLAVMKLGGDETVHIESITNPSCGNFSISAKTEGIKKPRMEVSLIKYTVESVDTEKMELKEEERDIIKKEERDISPDKPATIFFSIEEPLCGDILINICDETDILLYRQRIPFVFTLESNASASFLPTLDKLIVHLHTGSDSLISEGISANINVLAKDGKQALSTIKKIEYIEEEVEFNTHNLSPGIYSVKVIFEIEGRKLHEINLQFEKKERPVWLDNKLGYSEKPPWPWTEIKVDRDTIYCKDKYFRYKNSVLPSEISILNENILSSPAILKIFSEGVGYLTDNATMKVIKNTPSAVEFICEDKKGIFTVKTYNRLEFDGFLWIKIEVIPEISGIKLERLLLSIPLKKEYATHWYSGQYPVESLSGYTPEKEYVSLPVSGIRIGGYEQGIQWVWQSLKGWKLKKPETSMRFIPEREGFIVEFTIVDHPVDIKEPLVVELGIHALPAKPYPVEGIRGQWWAWAGHKNLGGINWFEWLSPGGRKVEIGPHQPHIGGRWNYLNMPDEYFEERKKEVLSLKSRRQDEYQWGPYLNHYITEANPSLAPETEYYYEEWRCAPSGRPDFKSLLSTSKSETAQVCYGSKSYQDYYVYYFHRFFSKYSKPEGLPFATYFDVSEPNPCANKYHNCGYTDEKGTYQPEVPVLAWRETMKRLYTIVKDMGKYNWMTTHMSGHPVMAYWSFNDVLIPGEQWAAYMVRKKAEYKAGGKKWPVSYTLTLPMERYRAEFSPWVWGPQTAFLTQSYAWLEPGDDFNDRHWCAINMVHDAFPYHSITYIKLFPFLREFGWDDKVECLPYWRNSKYITLNIYHQDHFVATLWKRETKLLTLIFNNTDEDKTSNISFNFKTLGIKDRDNADLIDVETKEIFKMKDGSVTVPVKKRDFRLLLLQ
ncbi:MAG: DUF6067 family protein, partial [Candidatus Omnitrophica bacterium]|nr:DUF6067 family protein [Candidatus Omnitrophota bacterium]